MVQQATMKAVTCPRYGSPEVLRLIEVPIPAPKPDQVRIRIYAAGVTMSDIFIRSARLPPLIQIPFRLMMGITRPRAPILGFVFSGVIDQVGARITRFKSGDEVYCTTGFSLGAYAEYRCMAETDSKNHLDSVGGLKSSPLKKAVKQAFKAGRSYVSIDDGDLLLESARLDQIRELVESGAIKPILGHTFPIEEIVEAHRLVQSGHKRGGVAVTIDS